MNWLSLLTLIAAAVTTHQAAFPLTLGGNHYLVTITQGPVSAGTSTKWIDLLQIVFRIMAGQLGTFTVGAFSVSLVPLSTTRGQSSSPSDPSSAQPSPGAVPQSNMPGASSPLR